MYNLDEQTPLDVGCVAIAVSLGGLEGFQELLSRRTKAEENRAPPTLSSLFPSIPPFICPHRLRYPNACHLTPLEGLPFQSCLLKRTHTDIVR